LKINLTEWLTIKHNQAHINQNYQTNFQVFNQLVKYHITGLKHVCSVCIMSVLMLN